MTPVIHKDLGGNRVMNTNSDPGCHRATDPDMCGSVLTDRHVMEVFFTLQVFSHDASDFNHIYSTIHRHMMVSRRFYPKAHSMTEFVLLPMWLKPIQAVFTPCIPVLGRSRSMTD